MTPVASTGFSRRSFIVGGGLCGVCAATGFLVGRRTSSTDRSAPVATADPRPGTETLTAGERLAAQPDGLFRIDTNEPIVALSFDDGPDPLYTTAVLDLLAKNGINATFFSVGVNAVAAPDLVRRLLDEGHSVGNHTFDHRELELLTVEDVQTEIEKGQTALISTGIPRPKMFRPPKGYTDEVVGVIADADRYRTVFWDGCVEHFVNHQPVADGVAQLVTKTRPGSILLAHDGGAIVGSGRSPISRARTLQALPILLDGLRRKGLEIVDVPTLLARTKTPLLPVPARR